MLEAIALCERDLRPRRWTTRCPTSPGSATTSGTSATWRLQADYPQWGLTYGIEDVLRDIYEYNAVRWGAETPTGQRAPLPAR